MFSDCPFNNQHYLIHCVLDLLWYNLWDEKMNSCARRYAEISWRKNLFFFQCYAHKYKRWVFVVKIIELSPPFDTVRDWIHRYLCWFIQWLASFGNHSTKNIFYIYIISTLELLWTSCYQFQWKYCHIFIQFSLLEIEYHFLIRHLNKQDMQRNVIYETDFMIPF